MVEDSSSLICLHSCPNQSNQQRLDQWSRWLAIKSSLLAQTTNTVGLINKISLTRLITRLSRSFKLVVIDIPDLKEF